MPKFPVDVDIVASNLILDRISHRCLRLVAHSLGSFILWDLLFSDTLSIMVFGSSYNES